MITRTRPLATATALATALTTALVSVPCFAGPPTQPTRPSDDAPPSDDATDSEPDPDATQPDPKLAKAMEHFAQGIALYEDSDFNGALFEFERAYASKPDYRLLYNIGVTRLETNDYAGAKQALEQYLEAGGDEIADERRDEVKSQLQTLAARVGTLTIECDHDGASVMVDGEAIGTTPLADPLVVNLGRRKVSVTLPGFRDHEQTLEVGGGATLAVDVTLTPVTQSQPVPTTPDTSTTNRRPLVIGAIVSASVAVAVGGGAAATGVLALQQDDDVERELGNLPADQSKVDQGVQRRQRLALTTDILIGVGAAFAVTAAALGIAAILKKRKSDRQPQLSWMLTGVRGRF